MLNNTQLAKVHLVTVNYKSENALLDLLDSIEKLNFDLRTIKILIIDASNDILQKKIPLNPNLNIEVVSLPENRGFAYGANIGLHMASLRCGNSTSETAVWLLNPDTKLESESLNELLSHFNPNTILGSAVTNGGFSKDSTTWGAGGSIDSHLNVEMRYCNQPLSDLPKDPFDCDYVPGCSMLIPASIIRDKKLLIPEEYFLYFEETDWCLNLKKIGVKMAIVPRSLVAHESQPNKMSDPFRVYFYNRSSYLFKLKNESNKMTQFLRLLKIAMGTPKLIFLVRNETDHIMRQTFKSHLKARLDAIRFFLFTKDKRRKNSLYRISLSRLSEFTKP